MEKIIVFTFLFASITVSAQNNAVEESAMKDLLQKDMAPKNLLKRIQQRRDVKKTGGRKLKF